MLRVAVSLQIDFALECLVANATREGLETRVLPHVGDEIRGLTEALPTNSALVRFLTWKDWNTERQTAIFAGLH